MAKINGVLLPLPSIPPFGMPTDVAPVTEAGTANAIARSDHKHKGVRSITAGEGISVDTTVGDVTISASGTFVKVAESTQLGNVITTPITFRQSVLADLDFSKFSYFVVFILAVQWPAAEFPEVPNAIGNISMVNVNGIIRVYLQDMLNPDPNSNKIKVEFAAPIGSITTEFLIDRIMITKDPLSGAVNLLAMSQSQHRMNNAITLVQPNIWTVKSGFLFVLPGSTATHKVNIVLEGEGIFYNMYSKIVFNKNLFSVLGV